MHNPIHFISERWRGRVPLRTMLWRDMALIGTLINLFASFLALMLVAQGAPGWVAVLVHFAPTPYNLLIVVAVWRSPHRRRSQAMAAGIWLLLMTVA